MSDDSQERAQKRTRDLLKRIFAYALPHKKIFFVTLLMTAIYAGAVSSRLVMVAYLTDGVLVPAKGGDEKGWYASIVDEGFDFFFPNREISRSYPVDFAAERVRVEKPDSFEASLTKSQKWIHSFKGGLVACSSRDSQDRLSHYSSPLHDLEVRPVTEPEEEAEIELPTAEFANIALKLGGFENKNYGLVFFRNYSAITPSQDEEKPGWYVRGGQYSLNTDSNYKDVVETDSNGLFLSKSPESSLNWSGDFKYRKSDVHHNVIIGSANATLHSIMVLAVLAAILAVVIAISNYLRGYLSQLVMLRTIASIREDLYEHLSHQSLEYFGDRKSGDLVSRLTNDVGTVQFSLRFLFGNVLQQPFLLGGGLILAFLASWQLTLVILPFFAIILLPILKSGRRVRKHGRGSLAKLGELTETMGQLLSGIRVVKAFGLEDEQSREFKQRNVSFISSSLKMVRAKMTSRSIVEGAYNLIGAGLLAAGGYLLLNNVIGLSPGDFIALLVAITSIYRPLKVMSKAYNTIQESAAGAERLLEILDAEPSIKDGSQAASLPPLASAIEFKDISFCYEEGEREVIKGLSFTAKKGQSIALVGPTGAGKSTVLDLLARFRDPSSGNILFDGIDLRQITHESLLAQIAIVSQDPFLFHSSVYENILNGRRSATREEVEMAAKAAAIHEEVMAMPNGYDTIIGDRGEKVSGGQRQRITIARAILKNAPILIMDEATSALDSASEKKVQQAISNLVEGRTTFIIAHRLSTIRHADLILVLEEGRVVESGTHNSLMEKAGLYARLQKLQES